MLKREEWLPFARELDWEFSYVSAGSAFPELAAGTPALSYAEWAKWEEPFKTSFAEYVEQQASKEAALQAVRELLSQRKDRLDRLDVRWISALKLHFALLPLAEFAASIGNLRAARFGRTAAWRQASLLGALDELRHAQIPLALGHDCVARDGQFDWTHRFYHSNNWVAIAARRLMDEMLLCSDPVEFSIATHFVFETAFTNLQFIGLSAVAHEVGDSLFERLLTSIQTDEARHAQIGHAVLDVVLKHDRERVQALVDKWFWRSWLVFSVVTGFTMDYLTPLEHRKKSFKEFVQEWVTEQFDATLSNFGLERPWYWAEFERSLEYFHHMVYASAYSYRATVWFDMVVPSPAERAWLREKYPQSFPEFEPIWEAISERWRGTDPGLDFAVHGTAIVSFCSLCGLVLSHGTPGHNDTEVIEHEGRQHAFCSGVCRVLFEKEPERYARHHDVVTRVLCGEAPGNLLAFLGYSGLGFDDWGKDAERGEYDWLARDASALRTSSTPPPHARSASERLVPLYGFVEGDTIGLLVLAHEDMSMADVAQRLRNAAALRVTRTDEYDLYRGEQRLSPESTVSELGLKVLARVDLRFRAGVAA
ncbi:MAG: toluene monooxygenase [Myxococcota bacterium]